MGIAESKEILLVGRLVVGAGIGKKRKNVNKLEKYESLCTTLGLASMTVPMYISEASPSQVRGTLVSCNVLVITFGQFVASCVCGAFSSDKVIYSCLIR